MKETQQFLNYYNNANLVIDGIIGTKSIAEMKKAISTLKGIYKEKTYTWTNMNLLAIRTNSVFNNVTSDWFLIVKDSGLIAVPCSTKAGNFWVYNPITTGGITGTATLKEGQYKDTYQFISSSNWRNLWLQTPYFHQIKPVTVYRDNTRDNKVDKIQEHTGLFGINIHTAGWNNLVNRWSAGCIVIPRQYWLSLLPNFTSGQIYNFTLISNDNI